MNLWSLRQGKGARKRKKRVGCGESSGHGKTCGRGNKGQMARSGHKHKPGFEGGQMRFIRRIPKHGFSNFNRIDMVPVNVGSLSIFDEGSVVDVQALRSSGLAKSVGAGVKILGNGDIGRKLTVRVQRFSATAKAKIEAAGGVCEVVPV